MRKLLIKGVGYTICAQILSFMLVFLCIIFLNNQIFSLIVGIAALFIQCGLYFNYAIDSAEKYRISTKNHKKNNMLIYPFVMSTGAAIPLFTMWVLLFISQNGLIIDILVLYKLFDRFFYIITDVIFCIETISSIENNELIILFGCCFIPYIVIFPSYLHITKRQITDIK